MEQLTFAFDWYNLGLIGRLLLFLLVPVAVYTLYFASVVLVHLRTLRKVLDDDSLRKTVTLLDRRSANLRQMMVAMFYLYGLAFFGQMQGAFFTPDNNRPVGLMVLENFSACFRFSRNVFLVFLVLHLVQWSVSARIRSVALRLDARLAVR